MRRISVIMLVALACLKAINVNSQENSEKYRDIHLRILKECAIRPSMDCCEMIVDCLSGFTDEVYKDPYATAIYAVGQLYVGSQKDGKGATRIVGVYESAISGLNGESDKDALAFIYSDMATSHHLFGNDIEAYNQQRRCDNLIENDNEYKLLSLSLLAKYSAYAKEYEVCKKAINDFFDLLERFEKSDCLAASLRYAAQALIQFGDYEKAIAVQKRAVGILAQEKSTELYNDIYVDAKSDLIDYLLKVGHNVEAFNLADELMHEDMENSAATSLKKYIICRKSMIFMEHLKDADEIMCGKITAVIEALTDDNRFRSSFYDRADDLNKYLILVKKGKTRQAGELWRHFHNKINNDNTVYPLERRNFELSFMSVRLLWNPYYSKHMSLSDIESCRDTFLNTFGDRHPLYALSQTCYLSKYYGDMAMHGQAVNEIMKLDRVFKDSRCENTLLYLRYSSELAKLFANYDYTKALTLFWDSYKRTSAINYYGEIFVETILNMAYMACVMNSPDQTSKLLGISQEWINGHLRDLKEAPLEIEIERAIAQLSINTGDVNAAIDHAKIGMNLSEKLYGRSSNSYNHFILLLARGYFFNRDYKNAIKTIEKIDDSYFPDHIKNDVIRNKINMYMAAGQYRSVVSCAIEFKKFIELQVSSQYPWMTQRERSRLFKTYDDFLVNTLPTYAVRIGNKDLTVSAYEGVVLKKSFLLNSDRMLAKVISESGDAELLEKHRMLRERQHTLYNAIQHPERVQIDCDVDLLKSEAENVERELLEMCRVYGGFTEGFVGCFEDVKRKLTHSDVAIEFATANNGADIIAFVLSADMQSPELVNVCKTADLPTAKDLSLSRSVWEPLAGFLRGKKNVYFAPAGRLYNLPIEFLPAYDDPDSLMCDKYAMHRLSSTRELAVNHKKSEGGNAVIFGGLDYSMPKDDLIASSRDNAPEESVFGRDDLASTLFSYNEKSERGLGCGLSNLAGTAVEAKNVYKTLSDCMNNVTIYQGDQGTETAFKSLTGKKVNLLHVATHGYYLSEFDVENQSCQFLGMNILDNKFGVDMSLYRSGLFMSGADNILTGVELPEDIDDGILTAQEIATLDLRGMDLAVLSACKTGVGDVTGDGVFGLQRGFKKAGVHSIMMSLWDVGDIPTSIFMTEFYKNYALGHSKQKSFDAARNALRLFVDKEGDHPYDNIRHYGAFILLDAIGE